MSTEVVTDTKERMVAVAPLEPMLHRGERALAIKTPDLAQHGLEADAVLVSVPRPTAQRWRAGRRSPPAAARGAGEP
jgi:hypothetical protein